jgi:hypothetical protein
MELLPEWKRIARRAWSFRLAIVAALLSGVEVALPLFVDELPRNLFASLAFVAAVGSAWARVVAQSRMHQE